MAPAEPAMPAAPAIPAPAPKQDDEVPTAMRIIEENCQSRTESVPPELLGGMDASWLPTEVTHGGATIFVLPLDEIRRI